MPTKVVGFAFIKTWNMLFGNESNYAHTKINKRNKMHSTKVAREITRINLKWDKSETENTIKPSWEHTLDCVSLTLDFILQIFSPPPFSFLCLFGGLFCFVLQSDPMYPRLVLNSLDTLEFRVQRAEVYRHVLPCQVNAVLGTKARTSCMLGSAANQATSQIVLASTVSPFKLYKSLKSTNLSFA